MAAALSFCPPLYAWQYSSAACDCVVNVMVFRHLSPVHVAPSWARMVCTCRSLNALPLKNAPSDMMLPGLKSYSDRISLCAAFASLTCTRQPTKRIRPAMMAIAATVATNVVAIMPMRCLRLALFHVLRSFLRRFFGTRDLRLPVLRLLVLRLRDLFPPVFPPLFPLRLVLRVILRVIGTVLYRARFILS